MSAAEAGARVIREWYEGAPKRPLTDVAVRVYEAMRKELSQLAQSADQTGVRPNDGKAASSTDWQDRVRDERAQLVDKLVKLGAFMQTDAFAALDFPDGSLMVEQMRSMRAYATALQKRIERFT